MIFAISSLPRLLKMMMSSIRFRNSGLKWARKRLANVGLRHSDADIRRHDDDGVLEVHRPALAVRQPTIIENLQHDVPDIRMRLLDFIQQDDRIRPPPDALGEIAALVIADISRRRSDQARHRMFFHVLRHIDADHRPLVVEEEFRESPRCFRFADAGRSEEHEHANRPVLILQSRARTPDRIRHRL